MRGRLGPRSDVTANGARRGPRPPVRADQRDAGGGAGGVVDLCVAETAEIGRKDGTWVSPLSVNDLPSFRLSVLPSHLTATLTDTATDPYRHPAPLVVTASPASGASYPSTSRCS